MRQLRSEQDHSSVWIKADVLPAGSIFTARIYPHLSIFLFFNQSSNSSRVMNFLPTSTFYNPNLISTYAFSAAQGCRIRLRTDMACRRRQFAYAKTFRWLTRNLYPISPSHLRPRRSCNRPCNCGTDDILQPANCHVADVIALGNVDQRLAIALPRESLVAFDAS